MRKIPVGGFTPSGESLTPNPEANQTVECNDVANCQITVWSQILQALAIRRKKPQNIARMLYIKL
jgi:hypothetical protein